MKPILIFFIVVTFVTTTLSIPLSPEEIIAAAISGENYLVEQDANIAAEGHNRNKRSPNRYHYTEEDEQSDSESEERIPIRRHGRHHGGHHVKSFPSIEEETQRRHNGRRDLPDDQDVLANVHGRTITADPEDAGKARYLVDVGGVYSPYTHYPSYGVAPAPLPYGYGGGVLVGK